MSLPRENSIPEEHKTRQHLRFVNEKKAAELNPEENAVTTEVKSQETNLKLAHSHSPICKLTNWINTQILSLKDDSNIFTQSKIQILLDLQKYLLSFEKKVNEDITLNHLINSWLNENITCQPLNAILTRREMLSISQFSNYLPKGINTFLKTYGSCTVQTIQQTVDINCVPPDILFKQILPKLSVEEITRFSCTNKFMLFNTKKTIQEFDGQVVYITANNNHAVAVTHAGKIFFYTKISKNSWHPLPEPPENGIHKCYLHGTAGSQLWLLSKTGKLYTTDLTDFHNHQSPWETIALPSDFRLDRLIMTAFTGDIYVFEKVCVFIVDKNNQLFAKGNNSFGVLGVGKESNDTKVITQWEKVLLPPDFVLDEIVPGHECNYFVGKNNKIYVCGRFSDSYARSGRHLIHTPTLLQANKEYIANVNLFVGKNEFFYTTYKNMEISLLFNDSKLIIDERRILSLPKNFEIDKIRRSSEGTYFIGKHGAVLEHTNSPKINFETPLFKDKLNVCTLPNDFVIQDIIPDNHLFTSIFFIGKNNKIYKCHFGTYANESCHQLATENFSTCNLHNKITIFACTDLLFISDAGQICKIYYKDEKMSVDKHMLPESKDDKPSCSIM